MSITKCVECEEHIKATDRFHKEHTYTEVDGMPMVSKVLMDFPKDVCCHCLGHEVGWCKETIESKAYLKEFNKAYLRSTGGIGRQGLKL